jgi:hypothetical protein
MILKSAFESSCKFKTTIHDFTLKVNYCIFGVYLLNVINMYIFVFKLTILIHKFFGHINDFTICLWDLNRVHYVKSLT